MNSHVTFILPTLNRRQWVKRALDSCLGCETDQIKPHVIVIDSESDDGTFSYLQELYGKDSRVHLYQNQRSDGCMESWFQGVKAVSTELAAFMFDDDVLSPFFSTMITEMAKQRSEFVMGSGQVCRVDELYPFRPTVNFRSYSRSELLLRYYGLRGGLEGAGLPVSPICCVLTSDLLRQWTQYARKFAEANAFRRHFMLQRAIGPDLMIILLPILKAPVPLLVTSSVVAQFSAHSGSITIKATAFDLAAGYWLARIWGFESIARSGEKWMAAWCAAYLLISGTRLILMRVLSFRLRWTGSLIREMQRIMSGVVRRKIVCLTLLACFRLAAEAFVRGLTRGTRRHSEESARADASGEREGARIHVQ